jgi:isopenicillin N synthase-like dioxygenase
MTIWR